MIEQPSVSFFARLWMAFICFWQILLHPRFAVAILPAYRTQRGLPASTLQPLAAPLRIETPDDMPRIVTYSRNSAGVSVPNRPGAAEVIAAPPPQAVERSAPAPVVHDRPASTASPASRAAEDRQLATLTSPATDRPPERVHASALWVLSMMQREGRLIDFLLEDVAPFSDSEVGAAARVVHEGCRRVLKEHLAVEPVLPEGEGDRVTVPSGFDAERIRLTGRVTGQPPFAGSLKHHGWVTRAVRFPTVSESIDPRVLAPAEVELA